jgi:hypothetical protein
MVGVCSKHGLLIDAGGCPMCNNNRLNAIAAEKKAKKDRIRQEKEWAAYQAEQKKLDAKSQKEKSVSPSREDSNANFEAGIVFFAALATGIFLYFILEIETIPAGIATALVTGIVYLLKKWVRRAIQAALMAAALFAVGYVIFDYLDHINAI